MNIALAPIAGHHVIGWIVIGLIAGALAGMVMRGRGFGLFRDVIVGLVGAVLGGLLLDLFSGEKTSPSFFVELVVAFIGAVVLLFLARMFTGRSSRT